MERGRTCPCRGRCLPWSQLTARFKQHLVFLCLSPRTWCLPASQGFVPVQSPEPSPWRGGHRVPVPSLIAFLGLFFGHEPRELKNK